MSNLVLINAQIIRVLARKLKLLTFSQNWENTLVPIKGRHRRWQQEQFFGIICKTLENVMTGKKYFRVYHYKTQATDR